MTFWSSQRLRAHLGALFPGGKQPKIDCNAITLTVAPEYYVSPSWSGKEKTPKTIAVLGKGECFVIPPGQFGFLQTAEHILVPCNAMGFISLKATYKLRGLVNVSGFHIDPGYQGPLLFAVFNAGPSDVHLQEGMDLFLVWLAALDEVSDDYRKKGYERDRFLKTVNQVSGPVKSGYDVIAKIDQIESKFHTLYTLVGVLITLWVATIARFVLVPDKPSPPSIAPALVQHIQQTTPPPTPLAGPSAPSSPAGRSIAPSPQKDAPPKSATPR